MRLLFLFLFIGSTQIINAQTSQQLPEPKPNPEFKRFVYEKQSSITLRPYDSLYFDIAYDKGKNWVFKFDFNAEEYPGIADDEFSEQILFEIPPPRGNTFNLSGKQLTQSKVIYSRSCFCPDSGPRLISKGNVKGKRVGKNRWLIEATLIVEPRPGRQGEPFTKTFKGYYNPGTLIY